MPCKSGSAKRDLTPGQFQSADLTDLLRANTSHLRIMSKGALAAWIEPRFGIPVLLTSCQKGPQKGPRNWSPMCSLCSLTSLFEVFCLEPSKSWFQTTSRQNDVSWVHGTFAEINYYPDAAEGGEGNISSKPCTNVRSASRKNISLLQLAQARDLTHWHRLK